MRQALQAGPHTAERERAGAMAGSVGMRRRRGRTVDKILKLIFQPSLRSTLAGMAGYSMWMVGIRFLEELQTRRRRQPCRRSEHAYGTDQHTLACWKQLGLGSSVRDIHSSSGLGLISPGDHYRFDTKHGTLAATTPIQCSVPVIPPSFLTPRTTEHREQSFK